MELEIYHYSLCVSLTLLLFFSFRFLFGKLPDKQIFRQYRISRMLMGIALLDLAANYSAHLFFDPSSGCPYQCHSHESLYILACRMAFW